VLDPRSWMLDKNARIGIKPKDVPAVAKLIRPPVPLDPMLT